MRRKSRQALVVIVVGLAALASPTPSFGTPSAASKRAEAASVLAQITRLDAGLAHAIEAYNLANVKLGRIQDDLRANTRALAIAKVSLARARAALSARIVAIYTTGQGSTLNVLVGASSLDDVLDQLDTVSRVSAEDAQILRQVTAFRSEVQKRAARLKRARAEQARLVAERASERASIESQLAHRRRLLASIRTEVERLQAAERQRQLELRHLAQQRLAGQRQQAATQALAGPVASTAPSTDATSVAPPSRYGGVVGIAMRYLGTPYRWGGADPSGFDCSGFVMYVYAQVGVSLPHNAAAQYGYGTPVSRSALQPGDLVFFNGLGHNGIYIGGGQFIHSPHTGDVVKISSLSGWYASTWVGARRL